MSTNGSVNVTRREFDGLESEVKEMNKELAEVKSDVKLIKNDVGWIKKVLSFCAVSIAAPLVIGLFSAVGILIYTMLTWSNGG